MDPPTLQANSADEAIQMCLASQTIVQFPLTQLSFPCVADAVCNLETTGDVIDVTAVTQQDDAPEQIDFHWMNVSQTDLRHRWTLTHPFLCAACPDTELRFSAPVTGSGIVYPTKLRHRILSSVHTWTLPTTQLMAFDGIQRRLALVTPAPQPVGNPTHTEPVAPDRE